MEIVGDYIAANEYGIAQHQEAWGTTIDRSNEIGPVKLSIRKVVELGLTDEELEAMILHELVHAVIHGWYGIDSERDDEAEVDEWMRDYGFAQQAELVAGIKERG